MGVGMKAGVQIEQLTIGVEIQYNLSFFLPVKES